MSKREATVRLLRQALRGVAADGAAAAPAATRQGAPNLRPGSTIRGFASRADPSTRGPVSYVSLGLTMATGAGLLYYYRTEKEKKLEAVSGRSAAVVGAAAIGGPFSLIDSKGNPFTDADLVGAFTLLYFGFTHCPDICPEELEKVAVAVDVAADAVKSPASIRPVFITVDPERDGPAQVGAYVAEFHPRMVGLTGSTDAVAAAAKAYRVYYTKATLGEITGAESGGGGGGKKKNKGKKAQEEDYLVDHSIITYLLDPEGKFVTFYGKNYTAEEMGASVAKHVAAWRAAHPDWPAKK